jgi:hypothetical protein
MDCLPYRVALARPRRIGSSKLDRGVALHVGKTSDAFECPAAPSTGQ